MEHANFLFRGVPVPPGEAKVEMVYEPHTFRTALFITLIGFTFLGAVGAAQFTKTTSRKTRPPKSATPS